VTILKKVRVEELGKDFSIYGSYFNPEDCGSALGGDNGPVRFYPDRILGLFEYSNGPAISVLKLKPREYKITSSEMHSHTEEIFGGFTREVIFHVAPAGGGQPDLGQVKVFRLPAGWWARVKRGVWHEAPFVVGTEEAVGIVVLPPATYTHDCLVVNLSESIGIE
jgi:ureidoglycolate hydrolase